jgi:hypothetical protein
MAMGVVLDLFPASLVDWLNQYTNSPNNTSTSKVS